MSHSLHERVRNECQEAGNHLRFFFFFRLYGGTVTHFANGLDCYYVSPCYYVDFCVSFHFYLSAAAVTSPQPWQGETHSERIFSIQILIYLLAELSINTTLKGVNIDICFVVKVKALHAFLNSSNSSNVCLRTCCWTSKQASCQSFGGLSESSGKCQHCPMETV